MSWYGVVWISSEDHGPLGGMQGGRHELCRLSLPRRPRRGDPLTIAGERYEVVEAGPIECRVRRPEVQGLDPTLVFDP
jgi:hypothetical protein